MIAHHATPMQIDATRLPTATTLEAEVVIVGAGPAGITLALELAGAGHRVLLVESGSGSYNTDVQRLGETSGHDSAHVPMSLATRRQIGGASNLWGGRCVPFDPIDLQRRVVTGNASWPIDYDQLAKYFPRACKWCTCGEPTFDATLIPSLAGESLVPGWPEREIRSTSLERWSSSTNFARTYRAQLRSSPNVTLISSLTCTEIITKSLGNSVEHLLARTLNGAEIKLRAKRYVLACGGIESTRLLFASRSSGGGAIGNHSRHLGRWYMAHLGASIAELHLSTAPERTIYDFERDPDGIYVRRRFTFSPDYLAEHDLPNVAMWLDNPEIADPSHGDAVLSLVYLVLVSPLSRYFVAEGIRRRKIDTANPGSKWLHVRNILRSLPRATKFSLMFGFERFVRRGYKVPGVFVPNASNVYRLYYHAEHLPHEDSRITPTCHVDALGMPRMQTQLRFKDEDIHAAIKAHEHFDRYLREHGIGFLRYLHEDREADLREQLLDGYHQAGTTRMSARPEDGVLDPQLAVHGFEDLFVASSSAFVTSGQANSTFMIVVFALRLADHLHRTLRRNVDPVTTRMHTSSADLTSHVVTETSATARRSNGLRDVTPHLGHVVGDTQGSSDRPVGDVEPA
jgi:choline dehydrogenase-like flavoprotein